jgi:acetyl esterase/lipase
MKLFATALLCLLLFLLSLLNWVSAEQLWLWKASLLAKEYGHWLAALAVLVWFSSYFQTKNKILLTIAHLLLLLSIAGFLNSLRLAYKNQSTWRQALGPNTKNLLSFKTLWMGQTETPVAYQRLTYNENIEPHLTLDYYPAQGANVKAVPWVVVVHGGGWNAGDSQQLPELNSILAQQGYAVFSINYRLAPEYKWPDAKQDLLNSIHFISERASQFNIDPANYALLGRSAGGQLAGVVAYSKINPSPKALVLFYTPTDLTFGYEAGSEDDILNSRALIRDYMGGNPFEKRAAYADASVIDHVSDHPVPTLLLHGIPDTLVWYKHSERLDARLKEAHIPDVFILLPWATHGFDFSLAGPGGQISTVATQKFLKTWLLKPTSALPTQPNQ